MATIDVKVFYLEMFKHPGITVDAPRDGLQVLHVKRPSVAYYRFLYNTVGNDYEWYTRGRMSDEQIAESLAHPLHEVHVLHVDGSPAGYAELDRRRPSDVELLQFGLMPEYIGKGLGRYFLHWTIDRVWSKQPERFWLHTCTKDHPRALPNYLKAGFNLYKERMTQREVQTGP